MGKQSKWLLVVLLFQTEFAWSNNARIFSVNEPPANYINSLGEADGYVVDIMKALQKKVGNNSIIEFVPEARALRFMETKPNALMFSLSKTAERNNNYHWIGQVMSKKWQVYSLNTANIEVNNLAQLKQMSIIGLVRGDVREEWLLDQDFTNLHSVTQHSQNIQRLLMGRVPVIVYEKQGLHYLCKEMNIDISLFKSIYTIEESPVFIVMSKSSTVEQVKPWQEAFEQLREEGEIERIATLWQAKLAHEYAIESEISQEVLVF